MKNISFDKRDVYCFTCKPTIKKHSNSDYEHFVNALQDNNSHYFAIDSLSGPDETLKTNTVNFGLKGELIYGSQLFNTESIVNLSNFHNPPIVENGMLYFKDNTSIFNYIEFLCSIIDSSDFSSSYISQNQALDLIEKQLGFVSLRAVTEEEFQRLNEIGWQRLEDIPDRHFIPDLATKSYLNENACVRIGNKITRYVCDRYSVTISVGNKLLLDQLIALSINATQTEIFQLQQHVQVGEYFCVEVLQGINHLNKNNEMDYYKSRGQIIESSISPVFPNNQTTGLQNFTVENLNKDFSNKILNGSLTIDNNFIDSSLRNYIDILSNPVHGGGNIGDYTFDKEIINTRDEHYPDGGGSGGIGGIRENVMSINNNTFSYKTTSAPSYFFSLPVVISPNPCGDPGLVKLYGCMMTVLVEIDNVIHSYACKAKYRIDWGDMTPITEKISSKGLNSSILDDVEHRYDTLGNKTIKIWAQPIDSSWVFTSWLGPKLLDVGLPLDCKWGTSFIRSIWHYYTPPGADTPNRAWKGVHWFQNWERPNRTKTGASTEAYMWKPGGWHLYNADQIAAGYFVKRTDSTCVELWNTGGERWPNGKSSTQIEHINGGWAGYKKFTSFHKLRLGTTWLHFDFVTYPC